MTVTASQIIAKAKSYLGYEEKASNKDLNSFHGNVGRNNYQKFQPIAGAGNGDQWCQYFVDAVFVEVSGSISAAEELLYMSQSKSMTGYTPTGREFFIKAGRYFSVPEPGDVVYFYSSPKGRIGHTGIVVSVNKSAKTFTTVEGNTSSTEYNENGGAVASHTFSYARIGGTNRVNGFGRPKYGKASKKEDDTCMVQLPVLEKGFKSNVVKSLQVLLIDRYKFSCGSGGVDGDFGTQTLRAVKRFQKKYGLKVDGVVGAKTWTALLTK